MSQETRPAKQASKHGVFALFLPRPVVSLVSLVSLVPGAYSLQLQRSRFCIKREQIRSWWRRVGSIFRIVNLYGMLVINYRVPRWSQGGALLLLPPLFHLIHISIYFSESCSSSRTLIISLLQKMRWYFVSRQPNFSPCPTMRPG